MLQLPKNNRLKNRRGTNKRKEPREGTRLRELWDLFQASPGQPIEVRFPNRTGKGYTNRQLDDLRDYYGLDIVAAGLGLWVLKGFWEGTDYTSYLQEGSNA